MPGPDPSRSGRTFVGGVESAYLPGTGVDLLERAHRTGVGAGLARLPDPALGARRLTGPAVPAPAEAAVSSAAPFRRAPLLGRISAALRLPAGVDGRCPTCRVPAPGPTEGVRR
jgi:hypothetical protein